ncbi:hypothetical protein [Thalassovita aquimarina]|nr:hypothetical protein [Thalassovita aquimarina]
MGIFAKKKRLGVGLAPVLIYQRAVDFSEIDHAKCHAAAVLRFGTPANG